MKGTWKGRSIDYTPGRLVAALKKGASVEAVRKLVEQEGGGVEYYSQADGVLDLVVPARNTLEVAARLSGRGEFRFVSPEIVEKGRHY